MFWEDCESAKHRSNFWLSIEGQKTFWTPTIIIKLRGREEQEMYDVLLIGGGVNRISDCKRAFPLVS